MTKRRVVGVVVVVLGLILAGVVGSTVTDSDDDAAETASSPDRDLAVTEEAGRQEPAPAAPGVADGIIGEPGDGGGEGARGGDAAVTDESVAVSAVPVPQLAPGSSRVIKNASLRIEIAGGDFQEQFDRATAVADEFGGFVSTSRVSQTDGTLQSGTLTMRVPSDRFESAVSRLKELGEVTGEERSGQDVTREFVDLEARLRQARTEESFFIRLLEDAESISDLIQIQSQLSSVQLRIEQLQGQLNFLEDQTELSTITVNLFEPGAEGEEPVQGLAEAWQRAVDGFQSVLAGAIISLGWLAPFLLLGLIGFGLWRMRRGRGDQESKED